MKRRRKKDSSNQIASKDDEAKAKKKRAKRRHTFDDKAWEAINKSRSTGEAKSAVELLREGVVQTAPVNKDKDDKEKTDKKKQQLRRRSTFNHLEDAEENKAITYGNLVQEFNRIQRELAQVQEQQLNHFMAIVGCEIASILFINDRTRELVLSVDGRWLSVSMDSGLAAHCATTGETLNITDAYADPRFNKAVDLMTGHHTSNLICAPIRAVKSGGKIVGVVQMLNKNNGSAFDRNDEQVLAVCVERVADDIYDIFKELLRLNDSISTFGSSFFPVASESQQNTGTRFMQATANTRVNEMLVRQSSSFSRDVVGSALNSVESVESLRKRYMSFEVGALSKEIGSTSFAK